MGFLNGVMMKGYLHVYKKEQVTLLLEPHLSSNKISNPSMNKATKKRKSTALPGRIAKKKKATSSKTSDAGTPKKARQKGNGAGAKAGKSTHARSAPRTPDCTKDKSHLLQSTPSTVMSNLTSSSKRAVSKMNSLMLKIPPEKIKRLQNAASTVSRHGTVDFKDASMIDWTSKKGLHTALEYHGEDKSDLENLDYHNKVLLLYNVFKPIDIRPIFQDIYQDAGKNWRSLKLQKHRTMKMLAPEFANACANILSARADLTVPEQITIKKEKLQRPAMP